MIISSNAQPIPKINSISPEWMQRGSTNEITITGENLGGATKFTVSGGPGVSVTLAPATHLPINVESPTAGISAVAVKNDKQVAARVAIAPEATLGAREVRVVSPAGVSNPVTLNVSHLPEIVEKQRSGNDPQIIQSPVAITGKISAAAESDVFQVTARKGETLIAEVYASRLGSALDSSLAISDLKGKELARNEDTHGLDSVLRFTVPEDGDYLLRLRDFRYQGGPDFRYRLLIGTFPYVSSVFPLGGRRDQNVEVELKGANLGGTSKVMLRIDPATPLGVQEIRANTAMGISNPFPFDVGDLPEFTESEPNSAIDQADAVVPPVVINGRIKGDKDYDAFKFSAQKDQQFILEIIANRFGSPLDALLTLTDASGNVIQRNDDANGADARIEHRFSQAGEYVVLVEDLLERNGENFNYRLSIRQPQRDFSVRFLPDNPRVNRGGHVPVRCELARLSGFAETVRIELSGLPPGLYCQPLILTRSKPDSGVLVVSATKDCPLGTVPIKIVATSVVNGKSVARTADPLSNDKSVKEAFLTVLEEPPFNLELATLSASVEQDQSTPVELIVQRRDGFTGEIKVIAEGFSAGREPITRSLEFEPVSIKQTESHATIRLRAKVDSEVGTRPIFLKAESSVSGQSVVQYSRALPLTIHEVPFVLSTTLKRLSITALPSGTQSAASEASFAVKSQRRSGFTNEIQLKLDGLPGGITAALDKIPANANETAVKLTASEKAPVGKEFSIKVLGTGQFNDRTYRHMPAEIKLIVSAPAGEAAVKTADIK